MKNLYMFAMCDYIQAGPQKFLLEEFLVPLGLQRLAHDPLATQLLEERCQSNQEYDQVVTFCYLSILV